MLDNEKVQEFLDQLADRFTGAEIVDILEDAGILDVYTVISFLEEFIIEGSKSFES